MDELILTFQNTALRNLGKPVEGKAQSKENQTGLDFVYK